MKKMTMILVVAVVGMLVLGYWVFIGFNTPVDDFTPPDPPNDFSNDGVTGGYIAYATVEVSYNINPYTGIYSGTQPTQGLNFASISIFPTVQPFVSMNEGRVYHPDKLQSSWGGEGGTGGEGSSTVTVSYYAVVSITGPQYESHWQSSNMGYANPQIQPVSSSFTSGRAFFYVDGTYTATVTFYQYINGMPTIVSVSHVSFQVSA